MFIGFAVFSSWMRSADIKQVIASQTRSDVNYPEIIMAKQPAKLS